MNQTPIIPNERDHFLVPVDFSESSIGALRRGRELARRQGADLHVMHVAPAFHVDWKHDTTQMQQAESDAARAKRATPDGGLGPVEGYLDEVSDGGRGGRRAQDPLVGRAAEQREAAALVTRALVGSAQLLVVEGAAGVGKSALARAVA